MAIREIVYASSATVNFSDQSLNALLDKARSKNLENGITGVLIYIDGSFIQLLEGEEPALSETFGRIAADPRHSGLTRLSDRMVEQRTFGDLLMGFRAISENDLRENPDLFVRDTGRWVINPESDIDHRLRVIFDTFFKINAAVRY